MAKKKLCIPCAGILPVSVTIKRMTDPPFARKHTQKHRMLHCQPPPFLFTNSFLGSYLARPLVLCRITCRGRVRHVVGCRLAVGVVHVHGGTAVLFGEQLLDLPVVHTGADREFKVFFGDGVPVLQHVLMIKLYFLSKSVGKHTLYTIITPRRLQTVAKNRPSR